MSGLVRPTCPSTLQAVMARVLSGLNQSPNQLLLNSLAVAGAKRSLIISTVRLRLHRSIEPKRLSWREKTPQGQSVDRSYDEMSDTAISF